MIHVDSKNWSSAEVLEEESLGICKKFVNS